MDSIFTWLIFPTSVKITSAYYPVLMSCSYGSLQYSYNIYTILKKPIQYEV